MLFIEVHTTLPPFPTSVGAARRFVRDVLVTRRVDDQVVETVELLTSEVVTNAIVHGRSAPQLVVEVAEEFVRVGVFDMSAEPPVRQHAGVEALSGRGVVIVEELSSAWWVTSDQAGNGKQVWFEVAR